VKNKKLLAALGASAVCAAILIAYYVRISTAQEQAAANTNGVVNPESANAGQTTQPLPTISERTFKPVPSEITGSYTEPVAQKDPEIKDSAKKDSDK
jgi:hypothetical protein